MAGSDGSKRYPPRGERQVTHEPMVPSYVFTHLALRPGTRVHVDDSGRLTLTDRMGDVSLSLAMEMPELERLRDQLDAYIMLKDMEAMEEARHMGPDQ